jgi:hypothetical protein
MRTWAVAALLLTGSVAGCAAPGQFDGTVPTVLMRPGTCHRLSDPAELYAASDVAPPVSCASPHQSETLALVKLPSTLARLPERPERAVDLASGACAVPNDENLRDYLGADEFDRQWGVDLWTKVPTRSEWSQGVRVARCDLMLGNDGQGGPPEITHRLRGALRLADSASIRHCRYHLKDVPCAEAHTAEEVGGWTGLIGKTYPGTRVAARWLHDECWRNAERYSAGAIERLPVRATAGSLSKAQWRRGMRTSECWITSEHGRAVRGTLRAGLEKGTRP